MTFQWRPILRVIVENKNGLFFRPTRHLLAFSNFALGWHHRFVVVNLFLIMQMKDDYSECVDNNHLKDTCHLTTIILYLSSEKIVQKNFRKMFSKFKIEKQQNVLYRRGPRHFEAEQSIIFLPLLEAFDARIRKRQEMTNCEPATWWKIWNWRKRGLKFQLSQELQLLWEEVARSRLAVDPVKYTVKFNVSRKSYWDVDKSARSLKRKKLKKYFQNAADILPAEFKPVEVCSNWKSVK